MGEVGESMAMTPATRGSLALAAVLSALALVGTTAAGAAKPLNRPADPVVVTGSEAKRLLGTRPGRVVAFSYSKQRRRWDAVPVQVDERAGVDLGRVYGGNPNGVVINSYTDPGTFVGPDPDPALDGDDEIATMARYAGSPARAHRRSVPRPEGVRRGSRVAVKVADPGRGAKRWLYLFGARSAKLDPAAGEDLVHYDFNLLSGDYRSTYRLADGPNPESSIVRTAYYRLRFSDRWINDVLEVRAPGAERSDIIDRRNAQFFPGYCGRSVDTFTDAEGAFIVNRDGPVRAIRSYVGANSGPLTQREHFFYDRREVVTTYLRVHPIPGVIDFWDYSPAATGMTYRASGLAGAVTVDGNPDPTAADAPRWEQLSGRQGTVTHVERLDTSVSDLPLDPYYLDQDQPNGGVERQCTGDGKAFGASGVWFNGAIPNTDPRRGPAARFVGERTVFYDRPGLGAAAARQRSGWVDRPLAVRVASRR